MAHSLPCANIPQPALGVDYMDLAADPLKRNAK